MRSYVIGRSPYADIVLADPTVDRRHAEVVTTEDGRLYLTDCVSEGGTWRRAASKQDGEAPLWSRLRQGFVSAQEPLRFGEHEASLEALLGAAAPADPEAGGRWRWDSLAGPEGEPALALKGNGGRANTQRPRGKVERDPVTGEIVAKRW